MTPSAHKPARPKTTRFRLLQQLVESWWDVQLRKLRAAVERGVTAALGLLLLAVFAGALLVAAAGHLLGGLSAALSTAWDGPGWTGDLAVGLLVPALILGLVLRAHRRQIRRRDAQSRLED